MKSLLVAFLLSFCVLPSVKAQETYQLRTAFIRISKWNKSASKWGEWGEAVKNDNLVVLKPSASGKSFEKIVIYSEPKQILNLATMKQVESDEPYGVKNSIGFECEAVDQDGDECEIVIILEKSPKRIQLFMTYNKLAMVSYVLHPIE